jgi:hypothetical protein
MSAKSCRGGRRRRLVRTHCSIISSGRRSKAVLLVVIFSIEDLLTTSEDIGTASVVIVLSLQIARLSPLLHGYLAALYRKQKLRAHGLSHKPITTCGSSGLKVQSLSGF